MVLFQVAKSVRLKSLTMQSICLAHKRSDCRFRLLFDDLQIGLRGSWEVLTTFRFAFQRRYFFPIFC